MKSPSLLILTLAAATIAGSSPVSPREIRALAASKNSDTNIYKRVDAGTDTYKEKGGTEIYKRADDVTEIYKRVDDGTDTYKEKDGTEIYKRADDETEIYKRADDETEIYKRADDGIEIYKE
jgi:hypothetical protein